jgi:hypothetical protein
MDLTIKIVDWVFFLTVIAAFVVSVRRRGNKDLRPIQVYIVVMLVEDILLEVIGRLPHVNDNLRYTNIVLNICSLFEISIIFYFLNKIIIKKSFRIVMLIFLILYLIVCLYVWAGKYKAFFYMVPQLFGLENFLITVSCLFYFYEVLNSEIIINIRSNSNFTVICGLLFYFSIMTPLSFSYFIWLKSAPELNSVIQIMNMIFYSILFISLIKAYLCPFPEQKHL